MIRLIVVVVPLVGDVHLEAVAGDPVGEERPRHRERRADQGDGVEPLLLAGLGHHVGEVQQWDVDRRLDLLGDPVERRGAQHQEVGAGALDALRGTGQDLRDVVPALLLLQRGDLGEVDRGHHGLRRAEPADPALDPQVQGLVVGGAALPAHPADQSDGLHGGSLPRDRAGGAAYSVTRCTLCWAAWARGRITRLSMLTCGGRVTIQVIASATSSATSGSATPA